MINIEQTFLHGELILGVNGISVWEAVSRPLQLKA
jgi:hypothetical protein